jgi:hypothetical protein
VRRHERGTIALSGKVVITLTNKPDEGSLSGKPSSSDELREQLDELMKLAEMVEGDSLNTAIHMRMLREAIAELRQ